MKKIIWPILLIIILVIWAIASMANAADYLPRCYFPVTNTRLVPTQLKTLSTGTGCYTGTRYKSMGIALLENSTGIFNNGVMTYKNDTIYYQPTGEYLRIAETNDDLWGTGFYLISQDGTYGYGLYNNYGRTIIQTGILNPTVTLLSSNKKLLGSAYSTQPEYPWIPATVEAFAVANLTVPLNDPSKALFIPSAQGFRTPPIWEDVRGIGWQDSRRVYIQDGDVLSKDGVNLTVLRGIYGLNDLYLYDASTINQNPVYYAIPSNYHLWIDYIKGKDKIPYENTRDFFAGWTIISSIQRI